MTEVALGVLSGGPGRGTPPGQTWLAVVPLSAEIDITNSRQAGIDLLAAFPSGVRLVIADMTATTVCDSSPAYGTSGAAGWLRCWCHGRRRGKVDG